MNRRNEISAGIKEILDRATGAAAPCDLFPGAFMSTGPREVLYGGRPQKDVPMLMGMDLASGPNRTVAVFSGGNGGGKTFTQFQHVTAAIARDLYRDASLATAVGRALDDLLADFTRFPDRLEPPGVWRDIPEEGMSYSRVITTGPNFGPRPAHVMPFDVASMEDAPGPGNAPALPPAPHPAGLAPSLRPPAPDYLAKLQALPEAERLALTEGDWKDVPGAE